MNPRPRRSNHPATDAPAAGPLPAVGVGRDNPGIISTGPDALNIRAEHAIVLPAGALIPPAKVDAPPGLANLPAPDGMFVGRDNDLARLEQALAGPAGVVVQAVHGLGGIGKSTLAIHYATRHRQDYQVIWWITADSPAGIDTGLANLATALQPGLAGLLPLQALRERAEAWLASHNRWLVVLDNVTDPRHIQPLLARAPAGRFLITSRRATGWHGIATSLLLGVLSPAQAEELLAGILGHGHDPARLDGAQALCAELGYLPLAIEQAGAYIAETGITPAEYVQLLAAYPADMYAQTAEGGDPQRTIARIWRVTLDQLASTPAAGQLLRVLAFFAPAGIPRTLLAGLVQPPPQLATAIGRLAAYSMITTSGETLSVHRLVQAVSRTPDPSDPHRAPAAIEEARELATALLATVAPPDVENPAWWPAWRVLHPHLGAFAGYTTADTDTDVTVGLLNRYAVFLADQGAPVPAIHLLQRSLDDCCRIHGEDHIQTLIVRNNLAGAYQTAGNLAKAITLFEASLAGRRRVLGNVHPETLTSCNNLAFAYRKAGDTTKAITLYETTVADSIRVLGPDHPRTLNLQGNLAQAYLQAGDLDRVIKLAKAVLDDSLRVLGDDHPQTLAARNNLAGAYREAGDLDRAIPLFKAVLDDNIRVLGPDHPKTLKLRSNLAQAHLHARDLIQAIKLAKAVLDDSLRVLGDDHPDTLSSRNNLAGAYQEAGNPRRAIPLYETTLAGRSRVLGDDNPDTLTSRNNLAGAYQKAGDLDRAITLYETSLADCTRVLGTHHPLTVTARGNLQRLARS